MIVVTCRRCSRMFNTTNVEQILCGNCQNIIKQCSENNFTLVKLKSAPDKWFRAIKYHADTKQVVVAESDIVTNTVDLNFVCAVGIGCEKCNPTGSHTRPTDIDRPPNILSPANLLKSRGHIFCFNCGRRL